ncbi:MAG: peptidoglycan editing factor PgeF [Desulfobacterales bacterium]|nr:MAG: peptidoglycan editing factor PgeF [Desulfobacterales bacterium]
MIFRSKNGTPFLQFASLAGFSKIRHGVFTRRCGCSQPPFQSLNISRGIGDDARHVAQNRQIIALCLEAGDLVFAQQVHGAQVCVLARDDRASNGRSARDRLLVGDSLVTDIPGKFLVIQVADCQSVMLYDPRRQVVANVHAGWRGSIRNIIGQTVQIMENRFGCEPPHLMAGVGPSLGPCCAEFVNYKGEIPPEFWAYKDDRDHFDFWTISSDQLIAAGLDTKNINLSKICTKCNTDMFFSYRGEGTTGRFAAVIGLA